MFTKHVSASRARSLSRASTRKNKEGQLNNLLFTLWRFVLCRRFFNINSILSLDKFPFAKLDSIINSFISFRIGREKEEAVAKNINILWVKNINNIIFALIRNSRQRALWLLRLAGYEQEERWRDFPSQFNYNATINLSQEAIFSPRQRPSKTNEKNIKQ